MSTTVINLNVLDTSKTNDGTGETITLAEVAAALFPTTNATQTQTIDSLFWGSGLQLTFQVGAAWYTISATSLYNIQVAQTDRYGTLTGSITSPISLVALTSPTVTLAQAFQNAVANATSNALTSTSGTHAEAEVEDTQV